MEVIEEEGEKDVIKKTMNDIVETRVDVFDTAQDYNRKILTSLMLDEGMKSERDEKRKKKANVIVTGGGLIFLLIAAALVTASFLMSPAIESMLSKL